MKKFLASLGLFFMVFLMLPTQAFAESTATPTESPTPTETATEDAKPTEEATKDESSNGSSNVITEVVTELKGNQVVEFGDAKFTNTDKLKERFFQSDIHIIKINQSDVTMDNQDFVKAVGLEAGDLFDSSSLLLMVVDNNDGKDKIYAMSSSDSQMEYAIETLGAESEDAGWTIFVNADALEDYSGGSNLLTGLFFGALIGILIACFIGMLSY